MIPNEKLHYIMLPYVTIPYHIPYNTIPKEETRSHCILQATQHTIILLHTITNQSTPKNAGLHTMHHTTYYEDMIPYLLFCKNHQLIPRSLFILITNWCQIFLICFTSRLKYPSTKWQQSCTEEIVLCAVYTTNSFINIT